MKTSNAGMRHHIALIEGWLEPGTAGSKSGTSVVPGMHNDSGVDITDGDVVVVLSDGTIELADVAQDTRPIGVAIDDIDDGDSGPVAWFGPVDRINTTGSVTAGNYAETTTTAGQATQNATRREGSFGYFTSTGTNPSGFLLGMSEGPGTGSPLTTKGDLYGFDTGDARVPVGTNGYLLVADSTDAQGIVWESPETTGHYEVLMTGASPAEPLEDGSGSDWLYVFVP